MSTPKKVSLAEYAAAKAPPPCYVCTLPERAEIDENRRGGVGYRFILEWLWEVRGYKTSGVGGVSASAIEKHFKQQHHYKGGTT